MSRSWSYIQNSQYIWKLFPHNIVCFLMGKTDILEKICMFWPLDHPSTKFRFAFWQGGICNTIYILFMICQRCAWNIRCVITHKVFYNLEPWFYQVIEASLEEAMSTKSTGVVFQPMVSFTIHSCFDFHLPSTWNKIGNESVINNIKDTKIRINLDKQYTVSNFWCTWLCILDELLMQCSFTHACTWTPMYSVSAGKEDNEHLCLWRDTI